ncbi:hypothetical protein [Echinicola arenosa]|nr:hypothetical protein [Echinicola arenosa]
MRNSTWLRFLWGIMGWYLLNISVDAADPFPNYVPEDLTFNDQESLVEIFIEKILGFENAIPEYDDPDTEDHNQKNIGKLDCILNSSHNFYEIPLLSIQLKLRFPAHTGQLINGFFRIDTPPPDFGLFG